MYPRTGQKRKVNDYPFSKRLRRTETASRRFSRSYPKQTGETKYFDTSGSSPVTWAGTDWSASEVPCTNYVNNAGTAAAYTDSCLLPTAVGSGYGEVNGNKYKLKKIRVRGSVGIAPLTSVDNTAGTPDARIRILLVMDTEAHGAQAQGEDVLQDIGGAFNNLYSFQRVSDNLGRFRILKDEWIELPNDFVSTVGATAAMTYRSQSFSWKYQPKAAIPVSIKSGGTTPAIGKTQSHNIFLMVAGASIGAAQTVNVNFCSRVYYYE